MPVPWRLSNWMRPRRPSPTAPMYLVRRPRAALGPFPRDAAAEVVADGADVLGAQAEAGAGDEGAGHLAAGAEVLLLEGDLAGIGREVRDDEQGIGGIQPQSNDVEF